MFGIRTLDSFYTYNFKNSTCEYFLNIINTTDNITDNINYKLLEKGICFH